MSQGWISRLVARFRAEGEAAFEPRSRRPRTSPGAIPDSTAELIVRLRKEPAGQGLDAGPRTIAWHLEHHHQARMSAATISRYLSRAPGWLPPSPNLMRDTPAMLRELNVVEQASSGDALTETTQAQQGTMNL